MTDLVFLDTETLGVHPDAPIWEFAAIRRFEDGTESTWQFCIKHAPLNWLNDLPDQFRADYEVRYNASEAISEQAAARDIHIATGGGHIIGCNPSFDTERLAKLLRRHKLEPAWHYHPDDTASLVKGYLAGKGNPPPVSEWKSDKLSAAVGVNPTTFPRHTAMGDVRWTIAQWDVVMADPQRGAVETYLLKLLEMYPDSVLLNRIEEMARQDGLNRITTQVEDYRRRYAAMQPTRKRWWKR